MHKIKIVTDSSCDIPEELVKQYDIAVVPLTITFSGQGFIDGVELSKTEFYEKLNACTELPGTSTPSPGDFVAVFQRALDAGQEVLGLFMSKELSSTCSTAEIAAGMLTTDKIKIIDTRFVSMGLGLLVLEAARMAEKGQNLAEITRGVYRMMDEMQVYFTMETLENLVKGGRIGKASAFVGSLLNIKPVMAIKEGIVTAIEKARGQGKALDRLVGNIAENTSGPIICSIVYAKEGKTLDSLVEKAKAGLNIKELIVSHIGPVVGTHAGDTVIGIMGLPVKE